jgi:CubicO group peptidase (beta-lactamase class C family)
MSIIKSMFDTLGSLIGQNVTAELDALAKAYVAAGKFTGTVLVAKAGKALLSEGYGLANREHNAPNTSQTVFRIGSMTKPFTALLVMQQVVAGKLTLEDRVSHFLPDFPHGERLTLHHLLSNRSGIPDYIAMPEYGRAIKQHLSTTDLIGLFRSKPLIFNPGTDYGYSNSNFVLLGAVLEQVTGHPYTQLVQERIFAPAGMTSSGYVWEERIIAGRASGYLDTGKGWQNAELHDESGLYAAGALYSTAEDLLRWDRALQSGLLLPASALAQMRQNLSPFGDSGYGYGWEMHSLHGHLGVGHSGGLPGYAANYLHFADGDVTIILLSNLGSAAWNEITRDLAAVVFDAPYQMPEKRAFVNVDPAILTAYEGVFELTYFGRTTMLTFAVEDGALTMETPGLPKAQTSALSETTFFARSKGEVELTFVRNEQGTVNEIALNWSGYALTAKRLS